MGGCDKQGFPMKQGVLTPGRVRLLLHRGLFIVHHLSVLVAFEYISTLPAKFWNSFVVIPQSCLVCKLHFWCIFLIVRLIGVEFVWTGTACFRGYGRRNGERRRKSVRGCIVSPDLSVLNLVIVKKGDNDLPGLTDVEKPRMRGPKRASKIRKLFNLSKDDDVRKYVNTYRRTFTTKSGECLNQLVY